MEGEDWNALQASISISMKHLDTFTCMGTPAENRYAKSFISLNSFPPLSNEPLTWLFLSFLILVGAIQYYSDSQSSKTVHSVLTTCHVPGPGLQDAGERQVPDLGGLCLAGAADPCAARIQGRVWEAYSRSKNKLRKERWSLWRLC